MADLCECGCGHPVTNATNRFIHGHHRRKREHQPCGIQDCGGKSKSHGLCSTHYSRLRTGYDMDAPLTRRSTPTAESFWALVDKTAGPDKCWPWLGRIDDDGYGVYNLRQFGNRPHRAAWFWTHGNLPERGLHLDHTCHSQVLDECPGGSECLHRRCCNPEHLEIVTAAVNVKRSHALTRYLAERTHCNHGHPLAGSNLARRPDGSRRCRRCAADATARYVTKKRRRAA